MKWFCIVILFRPNPWNVFTPALCTQDDRLNSPKFSSMAMISTGLPPLSQSTGWSCCLMSQCQLLIVTVSTVWVNPPPRGDLTFFHFFHKRLRIFNRFFTHLIYTFPSTLDCKFIFNYPQFWRTYAILSATTQFTCPPSAETHAFRRLRKSLIALLIVICGKSL